MILGNKCDVNDKRQVSKERGEKVGMVAGLGLALPDTSGQRDLSVWGSLHGGQPCPAPEDPPIAH